VAIVGRLYSIKQKKSLEKKPIDKNSGVSTRFLITKNEAFGGIQLKIISLPSASNINTSHD
jgi:hypothetical protein